MPIKAPKKLIEVALPLDAINDACVKEKSIRHGHPSTLHLWWARRPLAAARAVLFAQLVNDPGGDRGWGKFKGQTKEDAERERQRLFGIIRELVKWENTNDAVLLAKAREEIRRSWRETCELNSGQPGFDPERLPPFHDPFAGGGSIPLEAQRLGLEAHASDLNPVAVLINKAMIEIPPKFAGRPPVSPTPAGEKQIATSDARSWTGARGLAEDVRRYGAWMRDEAHKRIGHLYPNVKVTKEMAAHRPDLGQYVGKELTVIAWLWARTVPSPNPAVKGARVPLVSSFWLSKKTGKETWVEPIVDGRNYRFVVRRKKPRDAVAVDEGTKSGRGQFRCLLTGSAITSDHARSEGMAGHMSARLMAVVAEGERERVYLDPTGHMEKVAASASPDWRPRGAVPERLTGGTCYGYGLKEWGDLFTPRQLVALTTFSDLVAEAREHVLRDARAAGWQDDDRGLEVGGTGATAYGDALAIYLSMVVSRAADRNSSLCSWDPGPAGTKASTGGSARTASVRNTFARQALPMVWDFAEASPFSESGGGVDSGLKWICPAIERLCVGPTPGMAAQLDAAQIEAVNSVVLSTDPPYYDNIGYADLSDFFYVWLRRSLSARFPRTVATLLVPKTEELIASPHRHGGRAAAERFFQDGMSRTMRSFCSAVHPAFPATVYYAFKQSDTEGGETASTGWESFLEAVIRAGFTITATWPLRTELSNRIVGNRTNALASSIVLALWPLQSAATTVSRRDFLRELREELPLALELMIGGATGRAPVAPVDLAQAAIGPGIAIFSRHTQVLEADGSPMSVREALVHINKAIDDYFTAAEGVMDADTRFCIDWFQQNGFTKGKFGEADVLARAKGTSVEGVVKAGVLHSAKGDVRLLAVSEYPSDWDPETDDRLPIWEACHHLSRVLVESESAAGRLLARMPTLQEPIRQLAYRLYTLCERRGWAEDAGRYNALVTSWPAIVEHSREAGQAGEQLELV